MIHKKKVKALARSPEEEEVLEDGEEEEKEEPQLTLHLIGAKVAAN